MYKISILVIAVLTPAVFAKPYYEAPTADGINSIRPFDPPRTLWDSEADTNLTIAIASFLITLGLLWLNMYFPFDQIKLPLRGSKSLADAEDLADLQKRLLEALDKMEEEYNSRAELKKYEYQL